jgi:hypothetical protein
LRPRSGCAKSSGYCSVADPYHLDVDTDADPEPPTCHSDADPDPIFQFDADPGPIRNNRDFESEEQKNCSLSATNGILNRRNKKLSSIRNAGCRTGAACDSTCSATAHPSIRAHSAARHSPHRSTYTGILSGTGSVLYPSAVQR